MVEINQTYTYSLPDSNAELVVEKSHIDHHRLPNSDPTHVGHHRLPNADSTNVDHQRQNTITPSMSTLREHGVAEEYKILVDGNIIIDGGDEETVSYLLDVAEDVEEAVDVKNELLDCGYTEEELIENAEKVKQSVDKLHESMQVREAGKVGQLLFLLSAGENKTEDDAQDVRGWIENTEEKIEEAQEAIERMRKMADELLDDCEYLTTDIEEIRGEIYDSNLGSGQYVDQKQNREISENEVLKVVDDAVYFRVIRENKETGAKENVFTSESAAEAIAEFNEIVRDNSY